MTKTKIAIGLGNIILLSGILFYFIGVMEAELVIKAFMVLAFLILGTQLSVSSLFKKKA
ncbi:hypothetical protein LDL79_16150 [Leeuwenhoekiella palythoae]|uniref:hypothetical protein n=1 Tax=Leeuwenhoekiella palythoae TaxID=573501 RepID=UPI001CE0DDBD|nr:hypothetical protein [Leeuwenhoekiella palythoae]UBZ10317.1 hypothetical protein LDL79_16150 [Leeuwenhoekiella palythoae]